MWKCPKCGRSFKNTNQRHHCERTTAAAQLKNQPEVIVEIHDRLLDVVKKIGIFSVSPIKDYIMLKHKSTFLTIKPRKKYLDISFFLPEKTEEFPIFASLQQSKKRVLHAARLEKPADITKAVIQWIKQSYDLTNS
jgi:hypothetical protein